jgi:hypothetical protein
MKGIMALRKAPSPTPTPTFQLEEEIKFPILFLYQNNLSHTTDILHTVHIDVPHCKKTLGK